jgi:hypothetical protein
MRKLQLSEWASVAEIMGTVGIVLSLVFVGIQVRDNTRATQAASYQAAAEFDHQLLLTVGSDPDTAVAFSTYVRAPETLSGAAELQGRYLFGAMLRTMENFYIQNQLGTLSAASWETRRRLFEYIAVSSGYAAFLKTPSVNAMSGDFVEYMAELQSGAAGANP